MARKQQLQRQRAENPKRWRDGIAKARNGALGFLWPGSSSCCVRRCMSVAWPQKQQLQQLDHSGAGFAASNRYQIVLVEDCDVKQVPRSFSRRICDV